MLPTTPNALRIAFSTIAVALLPCYTPERRERFLESPDRLFTEGWVLLSCHFFCCKGGIAQLSKAPS